MLGSSSRCSSAFEYSAAEQWHPQARHLIAYSIYSLLRGGTLVLTSWPSIPFCSFAWASAALSLATPWHLGTWGPVVRWGLGIGTKMTKHWVKSGTLPRQGTAAQRS